MNLRRKLLAASIAAAVSAMLPATGYAQSGEPFRIGTILSVTGPGAFLGDHMKRRQLEHPSALSGARWRVSAHRG